MSVTYYPAHVIAEEDGGCTVEVPALAVREWGPTIRVALTRATAEVQNRVDDLDGRGQQLPATDMRAGEVAPHVISTFVPALTLENTLNTAVPVPFDLMVQIDALTENRETFVIDALRRAVATAKLTG